LPASCHLQKQRKEAKKAAEKHRVKSFEEHVILDVNLEGDHLKEIITSLRQAGAKKIYLSSRTLGGKMLCKSIVGLEMLKIEGCLLKCGVVMSTGCVGKKQRMAG
jgi:glutamine phosphoribosylpyrophosphate amidotransferase